MKTLEFSKRRLKLNIYGEVVSLVYPTVKEFKDFESESKESGFEKMASFLEMLGMSKEVMENLEVEHLNQIIAELTGNAEKK
tara:strand:+ start:2296 stop:2541 length:246 start_codon:yes stop_codon:yes gene_type:complete